ncbi:hypothetical protein WA158_003498 [Blastocystis sp. Blastoise]
MLTSIEKHKVNEVTVCNIKGALKNHSKSLPPPKRNAVLSDENCREFLNCPYEDLETLQLKVCLIIAICSGLRHGEIYNLKKKNLKFCEDCILIDVERSKTDYNGEGHNGYIPTVDGNVKFGLLIRKYFDCLSENEDGPLFPLITKNGFCSKSTGEKAIGNWPRRIAKMLNLPHSDSFTGHCFRRTMATLCAEHGATTEELMIQGRWKSASVANQYVNKSMSRRLEIAKKTIVASPKRMIGKPIENRSPIKSLLSENDLKNVFSDCFFNNSSITIQITFQIGIKKSSSFSQEIKN